ncbi:MAG: hypothetical protein WBD22_07295 [Pyrinomonadaceae bacterium]
MKNRPIPSLLLIAFLLSPFAAAQTNPGANYAIPREVNLDRIVRRSFPGYYGRNYPGGIYQRLYTDSFYPIGWSRDGKLAYYVEPVDEACGCYFAELKIVDLRTDTVLWEFNNKPEERTKPTGEILVDDMQQLWKRNRKLFSEKLAEHKIIPSRFTLLGRSFAAGGKTYTAKMTSPKGTDDDGRDRVKSVRLDLSAPRYGKKTLYSKTYSSDMFTSPLDTAVAGAFKSPFENRAAIVMINVQRGYEGPPHTVDLKITGADLVSGFKK